MPSTRETIKRGNLDVSYSDPEAVANTLTGASVPDRVKTLYVGVNTFSDSDGTVPVAAGAGTINIQVKTAVSNQAWESIGTITANALTTVSYTGPVTAVRAVPSGITTATHYRIVLWASE